MSNCNDYAEFACILTLETGAPPHRLLPLVRRLRRLARSHQRRCVESRSGCLRCKGWRAVMMTPSGEMGCDINREPEGSCRPCPCCQTDTIEEAIRATCEELTKLRGEKLGSEYQFTPKFSGDPRGYTVKLLLPSGSFNTMGGLEEGFGVPT